MKAFRSIFPSYIQILYSQPENYKKIEISVACISGENTIVGKSLYAVQTKCNTTELLGSLFVVRFVSLVRYANYNQTEIVCHMVS